MGFNSYANEKGNGGSFSEAYMYGTQDSYRQIILKISSFVTKHDREFAEFAPKKFARVSRELKLEIVNKTLVDKNGVSGRTCLNYPSALKIVCDVNKLERIQHNPKAQFVLMAHEVLGLLGIEMTSPYNPEQIDGYKISKRIAKYVTKVADYDLVFVNREDLIIELNEILSDTYDGRTPGFFYCAYIGYQQVFLDDHGWLTVESYTKETGGSSSCSYENDFSLSFTRFLDLRKVQEVISHHVPSDRNFDIAASLSFECSREDCLINEYGQTESGVSVIYFKFTHPVKAKRVKRLVEQLIDTYK